MQRKRFAVLGLGHFGYYAMRTLYESGKEVLAVDFSGEKVQAAAEYSTHAIAADVTDKDALIQAGVGEADAVIVSLGDRMDIITLAALHVKELKVPFVAVKALSEDHGKILRAIGVDQVIHPEKEMAVRVATRLALEDVVDFLPLLPGYSITEIKAPQEFVGKTLRELALRNTLRVQLVAIQHQRSGPNKMNIIPRAEDVIEENDLLILLGENKDLDRIREIVNNVPQKASRQ